MTIELGVLVAAIIALLGGAAGYGWLQRQVAGHKEEIINMSDQFSKLRDWKDGHDRESAEKRLEIERQIGSLRGNIIERDGKLDLIIARLDQLDKKFDRIEEQRERDRNADRNV